MYRVKVNGEEILVNPMRVSAYPINKVWQGAQRPVDQTEEAYFVSFDLEETPIQLTITVEREFKSFELRPLVLSAVANGNTISLTLQKPLQFTVEVDGHHHALHVFVNPPAKKPEGKLLYFGKGKHEAGLIWLESNQTLYLEEGAIVYGAIFAKDAENIKIMGRGVLNSSPYRRGNDDGKGGHEVRDALAARGLSPKDISYSGSLVLYHCKNVLIEGITLVDSMFWTLIVRNRCQDITIDNIKIVGQWRYNSDGIDICNSQNVLVKNSFIRSFDDCIVARGAYLDGEYGSVENVRVENCVLWCDWGIALEIWCGDKDTQVRNIVFEKNYIIRLSMCAIDIRTWFGSSDILVEDVLYKDIYINSEECYATPVFGSQMEETRTAPSGYRPHLCTIVAEKLGKNLGNQACEPVKPEGRFHLLYRNITLDHIVYTGVPLPVRIEEQKGILEIHNVTVVRSDSIPL